MDSLLSLATGGLALSVGLDLGVGKAAAWPQDVNVHSFIETQRSIALQGVLNNIGPDGSEVAGASAGIVVASPSKVDPDYFYTWTRDSALTMKMIIEEYILGSENAGIAKHVEDYIGAQAVLQTVTNPSGTLMPSGLGLAEPKFNVDGSRFNPMWGRPQRDGPSLRAIALIDYSWALIAEGQTDKVKTEIWPIIQNDLSYAGEHWNSTTWDLWEEVLGSSFFTTQSHYRALAEGGVLAAELGETCTGCDLAPNVLCMLQSFWNGDYLIANTNLKWENGRTGIDANTILGPIAVFDVKATCDSPTIQPCHSKSLANFKVYVDAFRNETHYPINAGIDEASGVALGRYTEDTYFGGNPWYLITTGAAEFLYDCVAAWIEQRELTIDSTSLPFFKELYPDAAIGTYPDTNSTDSVFQQIYLATMTYADSFVSIVQKYTPADGSLSEQFNRTHPGNPISAAKLTWSFSAFVTMSQRRAGEYPRSWTTGLSHDVPATCSTDTVAGVYDPAIGAGAPPVTAESLCTSTVQFLVNATTYYGENVYLTGDSAELGQWNPLNSQTMESKNYTTERPLWYAEVALKAGDTFSYGYVKKQDCDRGYVFETVNRTVVAPACVDGGKELGVLLTVDDAWDGANTTSGGCF
ncbi:unnamed protein product [Discula destructiva]